MIRDFYEIRLWKRGQEGKPYNYPISATAVLANFRLCDSCFPPTVLVPHVQGFDLPANIPVGARWVNSSILMPPFSGNLILSYANGVIANTIGFTTNSLGYNSTWSPSAAGGYNANAVITSGNVAQFNGANSVVTVSHSSLLLPAAFTVSLWINPTVFVGTGAYTRLVYLYPSTAYSLYFDNRNAGTGLVNAYVNGALHAQITIKRGIWTHVALTYNGTTVSLYGDGIANSQTYNTPLSYNLRLMRAGFPPVVLQRKIRSTYHATLDKADAGDLKPLAMLIARDVDRALDLWLSAAR